MKIRHFKFAPIIGFGYWRDDYNLDSIIVGHCHNVILPFIRIQYGYLRSRCESQ